MPRVAPHGAAILRFLYPAALLPRRPLCKSPAIPARPLAPPAPLRNMLMKHWRAPRRLAQQPALSPRHAPFRDVTIEKRSDWLRREESRARRRVWGGAGKAHEGSRTRGRPARNAPFRRASRTAPTNHWRARGRDPRADWSEPCGGGVAFWKVLGGYKRAPPRARGIERAGAELSGCPVCEREAGPDCG